MKRHQILFAVAALLAVLLGGALWFGNARAPESGLPAGGDFVLHGADGPVDTRTLRGKLLLVYFGYTCCPDICPNTLSAGAQALRLLAPEERQQVRMLMISVDPERDSLPHLRQYASFFHPEMLGVSGSLEEIAAVARQFGASFRKGALQPDGSYAIDHTTATYVVDAGGKLVATIPFGSPPEQVAAAVRRFL